MRTNSIQFTARVAAVLTLLLVVFAPFSMVYMPSTIIVPNDAAATTTNLLASEGLFRMSMVSDAIVFLIEVVLTVLLYVLLKPVNQTLSLAAAFARLSMTVVQGINLLNHFVVLLLIGGGAYLSVFAPAQVQALVLLFLNAHESVVLIWGAFFGLHLLLFGYLVFVSGYFPKFLGIILLVVAVYYLAQSLGTMLFPDAKALFASLSIVAMIEIAFPVWLLIKGVNLTVWNKHVAEVA